MKRFLLGKPKRESSLQFLIKSIPFSIALINYRKTNLTYRFSIIILYLWNLKQSTMKKYYTILLNVILVGVILYFYITHQPHTARMIIIYTAIALVPFVFFNLITRNYLAFKSYFISPLNILVEYKKETIEYELPPELMQEKLKEAVLKSPLKLKAFDDKKGLILATSSMNWKTWGENIYITLSTENNTTIATVEMTSIIQFSSWGRNKDHFESILNQFEESLII